MEIFELIEDYLIDQDDGLKKLLTWFLNLVMQLEAISQSGAKPFERNEMRTAQRNGYKERSLKTRVGELILKNLSSEVNHLNHVFSVKRRRTRAASCGASKAPPHKSGTRLS